MEQFLNLLLKLLLNIYNNTFQSLLSKHIIYPPGYCFYVCCDVKKDIFHLLFNFLRRFFFKKITLFIFVLIQS